MKTSFSKILILSTLLLVTYALSAQRKNSWTDRSIFGGNLGLQFGSMTEIDISPIMGYRITDDFNAGVGVTYMYYRNRDYTVISAGTYSTYDINTSIYGFNSYAQYTVFKDIYAHVEYEALNLEEKYFKNNITPDDDGRFWSHGVYVGGGYRFPIGERASFNVTVLYNLNEDMNSPYSNPVVRFGFNF